MSGSPSVAGIGVDTSLLQGVDAHLRRLRYHGRNGGAAAFDPRGDVAFIHGIDAVTDAVPLLLILPDVGSCYLAPVGDFMRTVANLVPEGERGAPMSEDQGVRLYDEFFALLEDDDAFRNDVVDWTWSHLFDAETLRAYATRFDLETVWANDAMAEHFDRAVESDPQRVRRVAARIVAHASQRGDLNRSVRELQEEYGLARRGGLSDGLDAVVKDISRLGPLADRVGTLPIALLILALSGSAFRRGWQYAAVLKKSTNAESYLPEPLRSDFMRATTVPEDTEAGPGTRVHYWSWGALLERAIAQAPTLWHDDRVRITLTQIRREGLGTSVPWDKRMPLAELVEEHAAQVRTLRELARDLQILVASDDVIERWSDVVTWSVRLAPFVLEKTLGRFLEPLFHHGALGVELGGLVALGALEHKYRTTIDAFSDGLRERLLASVLRVSGEGVARKIVGLDWSDADSVLFTARKAPSSIALPLH